MIFRIVIVCLALAAAYATYEIATVWRFNHAATSTDASFAVVNEGNKTDLTIVEFLNYDCLYCRGTHKTLMEYAKTHDNVRLVVRPFPNEGGLRYSEKAAAMALAAGLQGKFWDMDNAIIEYGGIPDDKFYRETAGLLDLDYERMVKDSQDETVQNMLTDNGSAIIRLGIKTTPAFMIGETLHQIDKPLTLPDLISMVTAERRAK